MTYTDTETLKLDTDEGLYYDWKRLSLENWTTPEFGGVVHGEKCTFGWDVPVFGALIRMMVFSTFNATGVVIAMVLRVAKIMALIAYCGTYIVKYIYHSIL